MQTIVRFVTVSLILVAAIMTTVVSAFQIASADSATIHFHDNENKNNEHHNENIIENNDDGSHHNGHCNENSNNDNGRVCQDNTH